MIVIGASVHKCYGLWTLEFDSRLFESCVEGRYAKIYSLFLFVKVSFQSVSVQSVRNKLNEF